MFTARADGRLVGLLPLGISVSDIDTARADGAREFDFLRGAEPYKYAWSAVDHPQLRLDLSADQPRQGGLRVLPGGLGRMPVVALAPSHAA